MTFRRNDGEIGLTARLNEDEEETAHLNIIARPVGELLYSRFIQAIQNRFVDPSDSKARKYSKELTVLMCGVGVPLLFTAQLRNSRMKDFIVLSLMHAGTSFLKSYQNTTGE